MITAGTDLNISIRKVDNSLSVAVMPRRNSLKEDMRRNMVPLVVNGTPAELDSGFLQAVVRPLQKVQGLLANAENFEKQAEKATAQARSSKTPTAPAESKEAKEKREKTEKLLKKADDAAAARRFSEAMTWLKQARLLAPAEKQREIDAKMQEVRKQSCEGSLFGMAEEPVPVMQPVPQQVPQPVYGMDGANMQPAPDRPAMQGAGMPQGGTAQSCPQQPYQPASVPYPPRQVQQPANGHAQNGTAQIQGGSGREYRAEPAGHETFCFDPDDENDRELLKEDPYAEYPDFPAECRMKDNAQIEDAQIEMVYC